MPSKGKGTKGVEKKSMGALCKDFASPWISVTEPVEKPVEMEVDEADTTRAPSPTGSSATLASTATTVPEKGKKRKYEDHQLRACHQCGEESHWRTMKAERVWKRDTD
eukprot:12631483-Alexandrium_andersonii.AAC.1